MTLSMQLAYFVPAKVRKRGKSYFQDGLVAVTVREADRVEATVTGSAGLGQATEDHVRFQPAQAALLDAWLTGEPEVTCDEVFERARQRLRSFAGIAPAAAPPGFRGELRGYQKAGLGWLPISWPALRPGRQEGARQGRGGSCR
jgi:hypothetical protein